MAQKGPISHFKRIQSIDRIFIIIMAIIFLWCYPTAGAINNDSQTTNSNPISERCQQTYRNLSSQQMARFVDASGKPGSGIYGGSTLWYGSYSECQKLANSRYCWTMFPGNITLVKNRKAEVYHIEWGVCMPDVCTREDVLKNFKFLFKNVSAIGGVTPFKKFLQVNCAENPEYTASVVITIILCVLLVMICLLATTMETLSKWYKRDKTETVEKNGDISMEEDPDERMPLLSHVTTKVEKNEDLCHHILHSFSMLRNIKSIMRTKVEESDLTYLHGIRVLSLFWIIVLHVHYQLFSSFWPYDNIKDVMRSSRRLAEMILNTAYGVDTFFVLSGLLVMYTNMNKKMKNNGQTNWFKYYLHRFWRLTPSYMFVILLVAKLRPFFGAGPVWFVAADTSACSDNWWTNLLYLNNFLKTDEGCVIPTWYLAADMQLFIVSPIFFLIAYRYGFRPLLYIVGVTIVASIIVTGCLAANDDAFPVFPPHHFLRLNIFFESQQEQIFKFGNAAEVGDDIYRKPYCRIPPYVMGMVLGYVLYKQFSKKFMLPWVGISVISNWFFW